MKKFLVVNPFGVGDAIFTFHAIREFRNAQPDARADFVANERTAELARMNPDVTRVYEFNRDALRRARSRDPLRFLKTYADLVGAWRRERYDAMLDYSLGREFGFLASLAGIPRRIGFDFRKRGFFLTERVAFEGYENAPVARAQRRLLELPLADRVPAELPWRIGGQDERRAEEILSGGGPWMALAPGGGRSWGADAVYKQWNPERFADAANAWASRQNASVMLLGDEPEKPLLLAVQQRLGPRSALVCGERFGTVAAALKRSRFLLCNDGGLLHFAHSLGVRTVSIFGPVDETVYGPYGEGVPHEVVTEPVPCRPCYRRFRFPPCGHERQCLERISVEKVLESVGRIA